VTVRALAGAENITSAMSAPRNFISNHPIKGIVNLE
jgi:hypothetical protein